MPHRRTLPNRLIEFCLLAVCFSLTVTSAAAEAGWKAGTAAAMITPEKPMWMAGYGHRDKPSEGALHPLWIKVLALEDAGGRRAIVLSSDLLGVPQSVYRHTVHALKEQFGLEPSQIVLTASHTHCGPVLRGALYDVYPLDDQQKTLIETYSVELEAKIVQSVGEALSKLAPARLHAGQGITRFAVNRRNNLEPDVSKLRESNALQGPMDHSVPVLTVTAPAGELRAVLFGYACHNTTLSFYQWCGDYAGFAQIALQRSHPGAVALFFMGCGADQNPLPRREVALAERYGQMLAAAVEEVLLQNPAPVEPKLRTSLEMVTLNLGAQPTSEEPEKMTIGQTNYLSRWAARLLDQSKSGQPFIRTYPYPVQVWKLGDRQLWITLGGEVVVDYALRFKQEYGAEVWVAGYCNDVMAYIPSARVLKEDVPPVASGRWGYEGNTSMYVYGLPAHRWADDIEELIAASVQRLVHRVKATEQQGGE